MDVIHREQRSRVTFKVETFWNSRTKRLLLIAIYAWTMFAAGYFVHRSGFSFGQVYRSLKRDLGQLPSRINAAVAKPEIEHITIDIQHDDFMRLAYQREVALIDGILLSDADDFVPASIQHNGKSVDVELRLKGDSTDHLAGDKWSYRVRVNGNETLLGMKQFSLQHPKTRNYLYEWILHKALDREDLIALRYDFVSVTLNGNDLGVYALEEHFEKRLIENNRSVEGPIVRFNQDLLWEEIVHNKSESDYIIVTSYLPVDIDTYQTNEMFTDPSSYDQHLRAIHLLESFRQGDLTTSEVFDVKKLANFFAIADLVGAQHSINWGNMRFYYNPISSRLEPIGFDGDSGRSIRAITPGLSPLVDPIYLERIFEDFFFYEEYVKTLERISSRSYLDELLFDLDDGMKKNINTLTSEFSEFEFTDEVLYRNQQFIRHVIDPVQALNAYYRGVDNDHLILELGNIQSMPVEILSLAYSDTVKLQPVEPTIVSERPVFHVQPMIDCRLRSIETVDYQVVKFAMPQNLDWSEEMAGNLRISYRILGTNQTREEDVIPWSFLEDDFINNDFFTEEPNINAFDFLATNDENQTIKVIPGAWQVDRNLIIPAGYVVKATGGTRLNLTDSAKILSYSPLEFIGEEGNPIIIQSTDSTGQGIVVMDVMNPSIFKHVTFRNLSVPSQAGWELSGAVTFYESAVAIENSQFIGSNSEDALNIVLSEFSIENTVFSNSLSDALDSDFSIGRISNSHFLKTGNDAIDTSGSVVEITHVTIDGAGDKGVSAGEKSQIIAEDVDITNGWIAVASKDLSHVVVRDLNIIDSGYGLAAYQKKSEYGPGSIEIHGLGITNVTVPHLVETASSLMVDDEVIFADQEKVYQKLYGEE